MAILRRVILKGFKSIKSMDLELRPLNVLIGANGAGKSNLVSFFKMLNEMMAGRLQQYIAGAGRAQSILYYGPKQTPALVAALQIEIGNEVVTYYARLSHVAGDTLVVDESIDAADGEATWHDTSRGPPHESWYLIASHGLESHIGHRADGGNALEQAVRQFLDGCRVYHFHDTSSTARVIQYCYIGDSRSLLPDGANLAAVLLRLREENRTVYHRIVATIRLVAPFFQDFDLEPAGPNKIEVILNWRDRGSDQVFGPHQLSDGTLRAMCLITLLMQPEDELPDLIIVDEPELGLHPYALNVVASLFKKASHHTQVLVSTQSSSFIDNFEPEDVVVVNREGRESRFERLDAARLEAWLEEYSLGEVWEKNVIGGGPH